MSTKKMLLLSLLSTVVTLFYDKILYMPAHLVRPFLVLLVLIAGVFIFLYSQGYLSEAKVMEKILEQQGSPLDRLHINHEKEFTKKSSVLKKEVGTTEIYKSEK